MPDVVPDLAHYEQLAANRLAETPSLDQDQVCLAIAREHGFRTWWRLLAVMATMCWWLHLKAL